MPIYKAPVEETLFLLDDVLHFERYGNLEGFADASRDVVEAVLNEAAKVAEEVLQPINMSGDREGCTRAPDGSVTTPKGFKEAYKAYAEGGWISLPMPVEYGGQGLPQVLSHGVAEYMMSANQAFAMYPGLTSGAIAAILVAGTEEQKQLYATRMIEGRWTGTMNLTEPHCGTDLGLLRTKAVPNGDGSYSITGQKIFISAGEHDLSENIIHLVLARMEGAPAGVKGISLFIVPKYVVSADGAIGARNPAVCGSLEHKMGIHANATCVMNYDGAQGWLLGEANKGLAAMFVMMNEARLGVAGQGLAQSEAAYQNAVAYANERLQGRSISGVKSPDKAADPIIVHPDVRRMLLEIKAFNEAARAFMLWTALEADILHRSPDPEARKAADDHLGLMTPILKGVLTDYGFDNAVKAQQVFGGHGYVGEYGMDQFVRDARIAMIYEGANGVQALDLVGRKLPKDGGRAITSFFKKVGDYVKEREGKDELKPYNAPLARALGDLQKATMWLMQNGMANPDNAGAASSDYMHLFGLVCLGFMWAQIAEAAMARKARDASQTAAMDAKLTTGKFFMERMLPETSLRLARINTGAATMMSLPAEMF